MSRSRGSVNKPRGRGEGGVPWLTPGGRVWQGLSTLSGRGQAGLSGWRLMGGTVGGGVWEMIIGQWQNLVGGDNGEGLRGAQWAGPSGWGVWVELSGRALSS